MKILRRIILIIAAISLLGIFAIADEGGYTVSSYDINMVVNDDNSYSITETITVNFTEQRHGIYRSIPMKLDSGRKAKIKATATGRKFETYEEDGNYIIKIGDANKYAAPVETYVIDYTYNIGYDYDDEKDILYFNLISAQIAAPIDRVSFRITLPAPYDEQMLKFYSGYYGRMTSNVDYTVYGQTIEGTISGGLIAYEALTVEIILPEGYYVNATPVTSLADYLSKVAPFLTLLLLGIAAFIWVRFCKNPKPAVSMRSFAPDGCNPADAAYILYGGVTSVQITSLLTFWASKGYLTISEDEYGLVLIKKMEMGNERKQYERELYSAIFRGSDTVSLEHETTKFQNAVNAAYSGVGKYWRSRQDSRIFETTGSVFYLPAALCWLAMSLAAVYGANAVWQGQMSSGLGVLACFALCLILTLLFMIEGAASPSYATRRPRGGMIAGGVTALFMVIIFAIIKMGFFASILILLSSAASWFLGTQMWNRRRRTEYGRGMLELTMGFKDFILYGDYEQIKELCQSYSNYYYDILAYAMAFGIEKKWTGHFKNYISRPPDWYTGAGSEPITPLVFLTSYSQSTAQIHSGLTGGTSSGSDDTSGSFSGGGSGGGGMGSW